MNATHRLRHDWMDTVIYFIRLAGELHRNIRIMNISASKPCISSIRLLIGSSTKLCQLCSITCH